MFRTVGNPNKIEFVLGGKAPFLDGGYDLIKAKQNSVEQKLQLKFLPSRDPLYTSWIALGDKKKIFGIIPSFFRNAPPYQYEYDSETQKIYRHSKGVVFLRKQCKTNSTISTNGKFF